MGVVCRPQADANVDAGFENRGLSLSYAKSCLALLSSSKTARSRRLLYSLVLAVVVKVD